MSFPDRALVRRMLRGEEHAFDEFFDGHFPGLFRFALARLGGNEDAAEEVAQATLCKAIPKLATFRGESALFTWLCTFCRHEIHARLRGRRLDSIDELSESALGRIATSPDESPADELERKEMGHLVHVALDRLPSHYGSALEWKYLEGLSVIEIAERLTVSPKAAESTLTRARDAFREVFRSLEAPR